MESPLEATKLNNAIVDTIAEPQSTVESMENIDEMPENATSATNTTPGGRRLTRSQTTGRPTIRWGKYGKEDDEPEVPQKGPASTLKRTFDARAVDDETDVEADPDSPYVPSKLAKIESTVLLSASSSATVVDDEEHTKHQSASPEPSGSPESAEYTFLDASSSSFSAERRGPRIRTAPPVPVPNLTKKSRGRRVPTAEDAEIERASQKGGRVYVCQVEDCGKCFSRGEHLKRHIRSIHTHEKPFKCPHPSCDKRFNRNDNLLQHLRVHKGDNSSQTSVDTVPAADDEEEEEEAEEEETAPRTSSAQVISHRTSSSKNTSSRRAPKPARKSKSAASTPPVTARLTASRVGRGINITLPRTYSLPPLPSLAPPYRSPTAACFMNNTNIAVSSLRTAIDESDLEADADEADGVESMESGIRSMYAFSESLRGTAYPARDASAQSDDVMRKANNAEMSSMNGTAAEGSSATKTPHSSTPQSVTPNPIPSPPSFLF
ncbi:hypothetical protein BJ138DRAFT_1176350 [Hygrophoropsis aurantiaca]|uniref:Uncharacterized protein n=1 Tax=Hygrophoropsis aurantiaca TaxID=72124 RepID=A0ACB8AQT3_9AGAM|nr:hypothetical protein BJ138DRAFT_1176350 [Hygrophoropsis aurantiaca]